MKEYKPHIYFRKGFWRVSLIPKPYVKAEPNSPIKQRWYKAHRYVTRMNGGQHG